MTYVHPGQPPAFFMNPPELPESFELKSVYTAPDKIQELERRIALMEKEFLGVKEPEEAIRNIHARRRARSLISLFALLFIITVFAMQVVHTVFYFGEGARETAGRHDAVMKAIAQVRALVTTGHSGTMVNAT